MNIIPLTLLLYIDNESCDVISLYVINQRFCHGQDIIKDEIGSLINAKKPNLLYYLLIAGEWRENWD